RVLFRLLIIVVTFCFALPVAASTLSTNQMLEVERRLSSLGYWITRADGRADASTRHAIMAFQKVEGLKRTGVMRATDIPALRLAKTPEAKNPTGPSHVEIDLTRQVLFFVDDAGIVTKILPVSTGNEKKFRDEGQWKTAHTPRGTFAIGLKINGVKKSSLGLLYNPSYFLGGLAIHGSNSIPPYAASHGCVRIPRFADPGFFKMTKIGMNVYLYE
ncbi:MAG TPA: L,D-transpeptidase family protein, partial [Pyrinomonadaceae bacterium]|nr:L,D-transpeptidase family protein [Pyrinomonadaceae bacterium]